MQENTTKRLSRLTAILTQLQAKRLVTAKMLADKFGVNIRTIYRDMRALEEAGVPILVEEGKGYKLMEDYRVPPVMFTESEAYALITAEQLILKNKDISFAKEYSEAITKIKSVLRNSTKEKADLLSERILFRQNINNDKTSGYLSVLQGAITNFNILKLTYTSESNETTQRNIEPFAMYNTQENWLLIAFCRLRKDFRAFRLDRIQQLEVLTDKFESHNMTLPEYFEMCKQKSNP
jgi:predicted DNA-binding transcriptional regulator YafY